MTAWTDSSRPAAERVEALLTDLRRGEGGPGQVGLAEGPAHTGRRVRGRRRDEDPVRGRPSRTRRPVRARHTRRPHREGVGLAAGERRRVTFQLHTDRMWCTGLAYERIVEPGAMVLSLGLAETDLPLTTPFTLIGRTRLVPEGRVLTTPVHIH